MHANHGLTLPAGHHYALTWGLPVEFVGMTAALLHRSRRRPICRPAARRQQGTCTSPRSKRSRSAARMALVAYMPVMIVKRVGAQTGAAAKAASGSFTAL